MLPGEPAAKSGKPPKAAILGDFANGNSAVHQQIARFLNAALLDVLKDRHFQFFLEKPVQVPLG